MKLKTYTYIYLIFLFVGSSNIMAQYNEHGPNWSDCDRAISNYSRDMDQCIRDFSDLLLMASGLPDPRDNPLFFTMDTYQYIVDSRSYSGAVNSWRAVADYFEASEQIYRQQGNAMDSIANTFFQSIEGLDC